MNNKYTVWLWMILIITVSCVSVFVGQIIGEQRQKWKSATYYGTLIQQHLKITIDDKPSFSRGMLLSSVMQDYETIRQIEQHRFLFKLYVHEEPFGPKWAKAFDYEAMSKEYGSYINLNPYENALSTKHHKPKYKQE